MLIIKSEIAEVWLQGISCTNKPLGPSSLSLKETTSVVLAIGRVIKSDLSHHCELSLYTL